MEYESSVPGCIRGPWDPMLGLRYSRGGSRTTAVSSSSTHTRWAVLQGWTPHLCKHLRWAASLAWADSHCSSGPSFRPCGQHRLGEQLHVYSPANVSALSLGVLVWLSPVWAVITRFIQGWAASLRSPAGRFGHHCSVGSFALIFQLHLRLALWNLAGPRRVAVSC